jgi:hypothetical protein
MQSDALVKYVTCLVALLLHNMVAWRFAWWLYKKHSEQIGLIAGSRSLVESIYFL